MSAIRAKFVVNVVSTHMDSSGNKTEQIKACAVTSGQEGSANKQWSKWTPQGNFEIWISNPDAMGRLPPGQFFYLDCTPCEKDSI